MKIESSKIDYYDFLQEDNDPVVFHRDGIALSGLNQINPCVVEGELFSSDMAGVFLVLISAGVRLYSLVIIKKEKSLIVYDSIGRYLNSEHHRPEDVTTIESTLRFAEQSLKPDKDTPLRVGWIDIRVLSILSSGLSTYSISKHFTVFCNPILNGTLIELAIPAIEIYDGINLYLLDQLTH